MVYLVGAGPGDAKLLTLRGSELLQRADVVVYDALVNQELLRLAPKSAEIIYGGKRIRTAVQSRDPEGASAPPQNQAASSVMSQAELNKLLI